MTLLVLVPRMIWRDGRAAFSNVPKPGLQFLRVAFSSVEVAMFFWAVSYLPLKDTTTFYLAGPISLTALSVLLLSERDVEAALDRRAGQDSAASSSRCGRPRPPRAAGADRALEGIIPMRW